jgi:hypothetical protein
MELAFPVLVSAFTCREKERKTRDNLLGQQVFEQKFVTGTS